MQSPSFPLTDRYTASETARFIEIVVIVTNLLVYYAFNASCLIIKTVAIHVVQQTVYCTAGKGDCCF